MTNFESTPTAEAETRASQAQGENDVAGEAAGAKMTKKRKGMIAALITALVIMVIALIWLLTNHKPLSELPGLSTSTMPHYEFSIYGMNQPLGVAANDSGDRIYVTESTGKSVVHVFDRAGKPTGTLSPPASTGQTHIPVYVAINPTTQDVYVSDRATSAIYVYDEQGQYLRSFAPKGDLGGKWNPLGLAFSADGTLYASDVRPVPAKSHRVLAFAPDGTLKLSMGTSGQLNFPNGIAVDPQGNIEVSDSNNGRVVVFDVTGKMIATISSGIGEGDLGLPRGAAVDDSGRLYVADTSDHQVRIYSIDKAKATPTYLGSFGTEGQLDGTFEYPNGVATDKRARVYITDRENNRVQVWGY